MGWLEAESVGLGYHYLYLWTRTAVKFYENLGYAICDRISLRRDCLKKLETTLVLGIEAILSRRRLMMVTT
jgi:hypothetical protein